MQVTDIHERMTKLAAKFGFNVVELKPETGALKIIASNPSLLTHVGLETKLDSVLPINVIREIKQHEKITAVHRYFSGIIHENVGTEWVVEWMLIFDGQFTYIGGIHMDGPKMGQLFSKHINFNTLYERFLSV